MLMYCTPETVKKLRDGLAKRKQASEPPGIYFPDEVIAILKAFDLAGMAHYNYTHENKLEYSTEEYSQEDINLAHNNTYLLVGVVEDLLDENAALRDQLTRLRGFVERVAVSFDNAGNDASTVKALYELSSEAKALLTRATAQPAATEDGGRESASGEETK